jgi:hypothetical protein
MALGQELLGAVSVMGWVCVGLVFILAATQKAQHWRVFSAVLANYRLLPKVLVTPVAALLPPAEMLVGILLLSAQIRPVGALAAMFLLVLFAAAMAINLRRGRSEIDCGCGRSFLKQTLSWILVARNAVLAALLVPALFVTTAMPMPDLLSGVGAGIGLFLLYLLLNIFSALPPAGRQRFA